MGKSGVTTFTIKDDKQFQMIKHVAGNQGKNLGDFLWDCAMIEANKLSRKTALYSGFTDLRFPEPPKDGYDLRTWKEYVKSLDVPKWKKFDKLVGELINLTNDKRTDLRRLGNKLH